MLDLPAYRTVHSHELFCLMVSLIVDPEGPCRVYTKTLGELLRSQNKH